MHNGNGMVCNGNGNNKININGKQYMLISFNFKYVMNVSIITLLLIVSLFCFSKLDEVQFANINKISFAYSNNFYII